MKYTFLWITFFLLLPFLVKSILMVVTIYKFYFINMLNSTYPFDMGLMGLFTIPSTDSKKDKKRPVGFSSTVDEPVEEKITVKSKKR